MSNLFESMAIPWNLYMIIIACYECDLKSKCADAINLSFYCHLYYCTSCRCRQKKHVFSWHLTDTEIYICLKKKENYYYQNVINCLFHVHSL